jgi:hypothetical protein
VRAGKTAQVSSWSLSAPSLPKHIPSSLPPSPNPFPLSLTQPSTSPSFPGPSNPSLPGRPSQSVCPSHPYALGSVEPPIPRVAFSRHPRHGADSLAGIPLCTSTLGDHSTPSRPLRAAPLTTGISGRLPLPDRRRPTHTLQSRLRYASPTATRE